ncbi:hypothetical protein I5M27_02410 [Adhaeribacter sp. BT258]|uniref:DNA-directed DNA polymerase family A palm domain-containing protein n=1 Tax=Adhaeribacter terrigena TaxID=2793070 RepID=A0ABS1BXF4_9BACT|nr:hypothetical protein [Adhaeribacter terrigena]MBK0401818.1 hypothetical protein [Adhaeribacter terrigena]
MKNEDLEIYTPKNFKAKEILRNEGWKDFMIERHSQELDFMLHQLYINQVTNNKYSKNDFIHLSRKYHFERFLTCRYTQILKPLLYKYKIIEEFDPLNIDHQNRNKKVKYEVATTENNFQGECKGYRLTKEYDVMHRRILVDKYTTLHKNILKYKQKDLSNQDDVTQWIQSKIQIISIRKYEAIRFVEDWYSKNLSKPDKIKLKRKQIKELNRLTTESAKYTYLKDILDNKLQKYLYSIYSIYDGTGFNAIRDEKGCRMHHPISTLWRELRQFLYIKENPKAQIYSIDVANAQPFCLVKILFKAFPNRNFPPDVNKYIQLVCEGKFYQYLADILKVAPEDIPEFKVTLFANVFYSLNQKGYYTKEAELFRQEFSTVYQIIQQEKMSNYKSLSIAMQKIESTAVIDGALTELMEKHKNNFSSQSHFFCSLHDSILCEGEYINEVQALVLKHFCSEVGIEPKLKAPETFNII